MAIITAVCGVVLILTVLWEGFETVVLPRRVTRRFRVTRLYYRCTWLPWRKMVNTIVPVRQRETWLSIFGPLSLLLLFGIWAWGLIAGYALLHWAGGSAFLTHDGSGGFLLDFYMSGTTFFTLGLGDVVPRGSEERFLVVVEAGMGFAFLALVISYLPALNQTFSRREVSVSLLDARAGSPPTASEMLRRNGRGQGMEELRLLFREWEQWAAELLEGHLSYPVLAYFRSQHDNQSWLAALTVILDTCALAMSGLEGACPRQAELTFAMARHAVVDICLVFRIRPRRTATNRLRPETLTALRATLAEVGIKLRRDEEDDLRLAEMRLLYEPYIIALAGYFRMTVPPWIAEGHWVDNWQASTRERGTNGKEAGERTMHEHF